MIRSGQTERPGCRKLHVTVEQNSGPPAFFLHGKLRPLGAGFEDVALFIAVSQYQDLHGKTP